MAARNLTNPSTAGKSLLKVETDHKPLVSIQKKPLADVSPRLQRLMLKLQRWDIKMEWTKGKDLHIPDTLSRACLKESKDDSKLDEEIECHVNSNPVLEEIPVSQIMWKKVAPHTEADVALQKVILCVTNGWKRLPQSVLPLPRRVNSDKWCCTERTTCNSTKVIATRNAQDHT